MKAILTALKTDTKVAIDWFINNYMRANLSKFQFMLLKHFSCNEDVPDLIEIYNIVITHHSHVKNENR